MPTPTNYNNIAYARHYKSVNVVKDNLDFVGVDLANKGSIDLPAFNGTNQAEGFFTHSTTASITDQAEVREDNYYACLPTDLSVGQSNDE